MSKCIKCGSYAFNLYKEGIDQGGLCDVHYWQGRAHRAEALAEQPAQQEPVALFKWLPEGATHIGRISVRTTAGGSLAMTTHAFKYEEAVLKVYITDNDNEYPGWRDAKDCFFHLNFPVLPLYTSPPAQRKPLSEEWIAYCWRKSMIGTRIHYVDYLALVREIERAHGIKEGK